VINPLPCVLVQKFSEATIAVPFFTGNWLDRRPTKVQLTESKMNSQRFWFWISLWQIFLSSMPLGTPISQADETTVMREMDLTSIDDAVIHSATFQSNT
jgi:hypothetical protein